MTRRTIVGQGWCLDCHQPVNSRFPRACPEGGTCMPQVDVRPGTLWLTSKNYLVLVMTEITDKVFNIAMWPDTGRSSIPGPGAKASMINATLLAMDAELLAEPLPGLVEFIERVTDEALANAQAEYEARHA